jgi:hypothetical protein
LLQLHLIHFSKKKEILNRRYYKSLPKLLFTFEKIPKEKKVMLCKEV